jgi:hypothetical protein
MGPPMARTTAANAWTSSSCSDTTSRHSWTPAPWSRRGVSVCVDGVGEGVDGVGVRAAAVEARGDGDFEIGDVVHVERDVVHAFEDVGSVAPTRLQGARRRRPRRGSRRVVATETTFRCAETPRTTTTAMSRGAETTSTLTEPPSTLAEPLSRSVWTTSTSSSSPSPLTRRAGRRSHGRPRERPLPRTSRRPRTHSFTLRRAVAIARRGGSRGLGRRWRRRRRGMLSVHPSQAFAALALSVCCTLLGVCTAIRARASSRESG